MNCPRCQARNSDEARFCFNCGAALTSPRPVEGERKFVTVLFADVVGNTAISERLDPEQLIEIMNGAFAIMNSAVVRYGGIVARLLGDAILAFFGAPIAHEDHAARAVHAGLAMQMAIQEYGRLVEERFGEMFQIRVGIHSGLVVLGMVGDEIRAEYTAMGETTNVASRLQHAAEPGTVLISADTNQLIRGLFDVRSRGRLELKGKSHPLEAYEVLAANPAGQPLRGLDEIVSPLVGRDDELSRLRMALQEVQRGQGALLLLIGEAGLGKSRLVAEARKLVDPDSVTWLEGRAISYGEPISYHPWQQVLRQSLQIEEQASPTSVRSRLQEALAALGISAEEQPFLEVLLGVEQEESLATLSEMDSELLLQRIVESVRVYIGLTAEKKPLVLVFDDLHWADDASLSLLLQMAELVQGWPLLIFGLLRPDRAAASWNFIQRAPSQFGDALTEIRLEPLGAHSAQQLLFNLITDLPERLRELLLQKAEGNPFFLEEVIRALIDAQHIVRENNHWRVSGSVENIAIPDTLIGVLTARIDRLPETSKQIAQMAAVIGRRFPYRALNALWQQVTGAAPPESLQEHLDRLVSEQLVQRLPAQLEREYKFKHALTQEAAYESLLISRRKMLHRETGAVLEMLYPERLEEWTPMLAHHFWQGEAWERAAQYASRAGGRALKVYALRQALEHYDRAYEAFNKLSPPPIAELLDAILNWSAVAYKLKIYDASLERLEQAERMAREQGDKPRLALALHWRGTIYVAMGAFSSAVPLLAENAQLAEEVGDERLSVVPRFFAALTLVDSEPRTAVTQLEGVIELARRIQDRTVEANALGFKAVAHARLGEFVQAREVIHRAVQVASRTESVLRQAELELMSGLVFYDVGDVDRGLEFSQRGMERARSENVLECTVAGLYCVGMGNLRTQDWTRALEAFQEAVTLSTSSGLEELNNQVRAGLAIARFYSGQPEAIAEIRTAMTNAEVLGDRYTTAYLAATLGEAHAHLNQYEQAGAYLNQALDYYRQENMRPYIIRTLNLLEDLLLRQGRMAEAETARNEASAAEAALRQADVMPGDENDAEVRLAFA